MEEIKEQAGSLRHIFFNQFLRSATPQERREKRLNIIKREAPPFEEAHGARAGRLFLAAGAAQNKGEMLVTDWLWFEYVWPPFGKKNALLCVYGF